MIGSDNLNLSDVNLRLLLSKTGAKGAQNMNRIDSSNNLVEMGTARSVSHYSGTAMPTIPNTAYAFQYGRPDWRCSYCKSLNPAERYHCSQCSAGKK